jgi:hypothetical protein
VRAGQAWIVSDSGTLPAVQIIKDRARFSQCCVAAQGSAIWPMCSHCSCMLVQVDGVLAHGAIIGWLIPFFVRLHSR